MLISITNTENNATTTADTARSPKMRGNERDLLFFAALFFGISNTGRTDPASLAEYQEQAQIVQTSPVDHRPLTIILEPYVFTRPERSIIPTVDDYEPDAIPETLTPAERLTSTTAPTIRCESCRIEYGVTAEEFDSDDPVPCPVCDGGIPHPKGATRQ